MLYHVPCFLSRDGGNTSDPGVKTERVQDQKEKMQVELQTLWREQCDQLRRKKEQCATEVNEILFFDKYSNTQILLKN